MIVYCFFVQAKALDQAMKEINNRFGKNSVMKLGANTFGEVYVIDPCTTWDFFSCLCCVWNEEYI